MAKENTADVLIIGGGIIGCAAGYYLAKAGRKVIVFEKGHLCAGSTGRCIGGIRQQFSSPSTIRAAMDSIEAFRSMEKEFGHSVEWFAGGYLLMAHSQEKKRDIIAAMEIQRSQGVPVNFLTPADVKEIVPQLVTDGLLGAAYCAEDGQANPFLVVKGYADGIQRAGGLVLRHTPVTEIEVRNGKVVSVAASGTRYSGEAVLNAGGPYAPEIARMAGLELPIFPERHEAMVTEGVERQFDPMLVDYRPEGCYFYQRRDSGQFIGCYTPKEVVPGTREDTTFEFFTELPRRMMRLVPSVADICVLRHWAGSYEMTPDGNPLLGKTEIGGFFVAAGMCGHGFMLGPAMGRLTAELITSGKTYMPIADFSPARKFDRKELLK